MVFRVSPWPLAKNTVEFHSNTHMNIQAISNGCVRGSFELTLISIVRSTVRNKLVWRNGCSHSYAHLIGTVVCSQLDWKQNECPKSYDDSYEFELILEYILLLGHSSTKVWSTDQRPISLTKGLAVLCSYRLRSWNPFQKQVEVPVEIFSDVRCSLHKLT